MKHVFKYEMSHDGKDPKGNDYSTVTCKNKTQKAAFQKYGWKSKPLGLNPNTKKDDLIQILRMQGVKVTDRHIKMTRDELIQEI